ncbi:RNA polymerase recycling motor HelD [Bacillus sp. JCM 19034]|uniref:RNA polymerase recycling motor HelD n=1 Tax=Bacillus sp. JCM 19034 TaxID=1481928 RepID=UPI00078332AA|nr:RNA polymerase recycling motor HelD [Bacillus sp. JCM 19034]
MQRVAYLLYRYREQMNADQVILFSPNALFNQYVAQVLPELGEENMQQTTFQAYLEHRLSTEWRIEDSYDQLEYVLTRQHDSDYFQRLESIGIKSSLVFMDELDRYFQSLQQKGLLFRDINFRGQRLFQANWIQEHFYKIDQSLSTPHRLEILIDILLKHLDIFEKEERKKNWVLEEVEQLSVEVIQSVFKRVERESDGYMDELRQEQLLRALVVRRKLKPIRAFIQQARFLDLSMLYKDFLQNIQRQLFSNYLYFNEVIDTTIQRLQNRQLYYEDMTPYLYLKSMIEGFEVNMAIRHVLIDEAQDYSPFQLSYILKLFPKARFTILGDLNQAIYAHSYQSKSFQLFSSNLFDGKVETYSLTKSYRSTRQIMELANRIIQSDIEPFNRTGVKPTLIKIDNEKERCKEIIQLVKKTNANSDRKLAIICKSDQQAYIAYKQLKEQLDVTYVKKDTTEVSNSVIVTPAYLAKGMEYDHVIVYDASSDSYAEEKDRNMIYITCTRAMHTLHLFYQGELSSLLPDQESGLYMTNFN